MNTLDCKEELLSNIWIYNLEACFDSDSSIAFQSNENNVCSNWSAFPKNICKNLLKHQAAMS